MERAMFFRSGMIPVIVVLVTLIGLVPFIFIEHARLPGSPSPVHANDMLPPSSAPQAQVDVPLRPGLNRWLIGINAHSYELIHRVAYAPDKKTAITGSCEQADHTCVRGELMLWDVDQDSPTFGQALHTFYGHTSAISAIAYAPNSQNAISVAEDQTMILWDVDQDSPTFGQALHTFDNLGGRKAAVAPDGLTVLVGGCDEYVGEFGECIRGQIEVWDVAPDSLTFGQLLHVFTFDGYSSTVSSLVYAPDGQTALIGTDGGTLMLWDMAQDSVTFGQPLLTIADGHMSEGAKRVVGDELIPVAFKIYSVAFAPDGRTALSGSCREYGGDVCGEGEIILWDMAPDSPTFGKTLQTLHGHAGAAWSVAYAPDGRTALSGGCGGISEDYCMEGEIILWDVVPDSPTFGQTLQTATTLSRVISLAYAPDSQSVIGNGSDAFILWDLTPTSTVYGEPIHVFREPIAPNAVAFAPDGRTAVSDDHFSLVLWDVAQDSPTFGQILYAFPEEHTNGITDVAYAADGRTALSASLDDTLILWDVAQDSPTFGQSLHTFTGHTGQIESVALAPDGQTALSTSRNDGTLILWDVDVNSPTFGQTLHTFSGHTRLMEGVAFGPDGRTALSTGCRNRGDEPCEQSEMILWNVDRNSPTFGQALHTFTDEQVGRLWGVAYAPNGQTALTVGRGYRMILWDVAQDSPTFGQILHMFPAKQTWLITHVTYAPDGQTALTASSDQTVLLWDVDRNSPTFGQVLQTLDGHAAGVGYVAYAPDGQTALSVSYSFSTGMILWDISLSRGN